MEMQLSTGKESVGSDFDDESSSLTGNEQFMVQAVSGIAAKSNENISRKISIHLFGLLTVTVTSLSLIHQISFKMKCHCTSMHLAKSYVNAVLWQKM